MVPSTNHRSLRLACPFIIVLLLFLYKASGFIIAPTTTTRRPVSSSGPSAGLCRRYHHHHGSCYYSSTKTTTNIFPAINRRCHHELIPSTSSTAIKATTTSSSDSTTTSNRKKRLLATGMAFLTGWADVFLFLKYKTFATMMTGNIMWLATSIIEKKLSNIVYYSSIIISYCFGISIFRCMDLSYRKKSLRLCSIIILVLFMVSDIIFAFANNTKYSRLVPVMMLATGFGIINSIGSEVAGILTFVVTGHITKLTNMIVDRFSAITTTTTSNSISREQQQGRSKTKNKLGEKDWEAIKQNLVVVGGFFGGALFACWLQLTTNGMITPKIFSLLGLFYAILFYSVDMESLKGAWWLRKNELMCDDIDDDGTICDLPDQEEQETTTKLSKNKK